MRTIASVVTRRHEKHTVAAGFETVRTHDALLQGKPTPRSSGESLPDQSFSHIPILTDASGLMDVLPIPIGLYDPAGQLRYRNRALERVLETAPHGFLDAMARLVEETRGSAFAGGSLRNRFRAPAEQPSNAPSTLLSASWRLNAYPVPSGSTGAGDGWFLLCAERRSTLAEGLRLIEATFGLTKREVQVAALLGQGYCTSEVAKALSISQNTARRHTESVFKKLGAHSRAAVATRIFTEPADVQDQVAKAPGEEPPGSQERSGVPAGAARRSISGKAVL